ncbi:hypothetical protein MERGE_002508 [Pneumocystis wakefieldiae]|uniref:Major facilitator superfamily (MFS) profile domain-containing protein n=1 Tax=Pneumocystis wakefieldiae TaxID=38082 RepID=A0A899FTU6_9ASCO|nr:hypothetical protein MERGE_002508 [Pneumocystis wakefieldiae]
MISDGLSEESYLLGQKTQRDVEGIEDISVIWTKQSLNSVFVVMYCISLEAQTTSNFILPATSSFGKNSLIPLINTINGILYTAVKQQMLRLSGLIGIMELFCISLLLYDIGCLMYMISKNIITFIISSIFHTIGTAGFQVLQQFVITDTSELLNRGLFNAILNIPLLINVWVGPNLAQSIYMPKSDSEQWRWGYGIWAIVLSVVSLPMISILYLNRMKAKEMGLLSIENNHSKTIPAFIKRLFVELDLVGIIILSLGFSLFFFQLIHEFPILYNAKSLYISSILIILIVLCVIFPLWELHYAKFPIFSKGLFKMEEITIGYFSSFFYFMGFYLYNNYFTTYLYVTKSNSIKRIGYLNNVFSFTSTIVAIFVGIFVKYNKIYRIFVYIGSPIYVIGMIFMIYNVRADESVMEMVISQAIIGISGGFYNMSTLIGIQTSSTRQQVAINTAVFLTLASIGGAIGSAISGIVWSNLLPKMLDFYSKYLNLFLTPSDYLLIIGSPFMLDQREKFAKGTVGRMVIVLAYNYVMKTLYICSVICAVPMLLCVIFTENIQIDKTAQDSFKINDMYRGSNELK